MKLILKISFIQITDGRNRVITEKIEETELILETIGNLPDSRKVLREVEGRLIPHTISQIKPALQSHLSALKNNQK